MKSRGPTSAQKNRKSTLFSLLTLGATLAILLLILAILANVFLNGFPYLSWRLVSSGTREGMFDIQTAGLFPMIFGTAALVLLMTVFVMPIGVATAIYLHEYARADSLFTRVIRSAINNLAGVPSIVFGLFGLGFFIYFLGGAIDRTFFDGRLVWGQPALLWASLTMAALTLPVVIVASEEALRAVPREHREASLALGATKLQTIVRVVLPQSLAGILTGGILAVGRGAGEVAPIMFTGAVFYMAGLPEALNQQFMHLGYHVFILSTQSPDVEKTKPILYATVVVLILLTLALNAVAIAIRARIQSRK
jgi:phosphate transport system permease protein